MATLSFKTAGKPNAVVGFSESARQARDLASAFMVPCEIAKVHVFPDKETLVQVSAAHKHVVVYRSLHHPNEKLFEILQAASALRDLGADRITLIAPYLPYMRQDIAFRPGEAVSQRVIGRLIAGSFDGLVSVDPHLHRVRDLSSVIEGKPARAISAAPAIVAHIRARNIPRDTLILGPDEESHGFARDVATPLCLEWGVGNKVRRGDRLVDIQLPYDLRTSGRSVIIVDDVISSGTTIATLTRQARIRGAASVDVYATHILANEKDVAMTRQAGVRHLVSSDSIPHSTNDMSVVDVISSALVGDGGLA